MLKFSKGAAEFLNAGGLSSDVCAALTSPRFEADFPARGVRRLAHELLCRHILVRFSRVSSKLMSPSRLVFPFHGSRDVFRMVCFGKPQFTHLLRDECVGLLDDFSEGFDEFV